MSRLRESHSLIEGLQVGFLDFRQIDRDALAHYSVEFFEDGAPKL